MPKDGELLCINIHPDGKVCINLDLSCKNVVGTAVSVPPHGWLIDLAAAVELVMQYCHDDDGSCSKAGVDLRELLDEIENLPTIIPADTKRGDDE